MKKTLLMFPAMIAFLAGSAVADPPDFDEADRDGDGVLTHAELRQAIPELSVPELNQREEVGRNEVRAALPNVDFDPADDGPIREEEYQEIIMAMEQRDAGRDATRQQDAVPDTTTPASPDRRQPQTPDPTTPLGGTTGDGGLPPAAGG